MIKKSFVFQNSGAFIEDIYNPQSGEIDGRTFIIVDNDTGDIYRMPLTLEACSKLGSQLMGLGSLKVIGGDRNGGGVAPDLKAAVDKHQGGKKK